MQMNKLSYILLSKTSGYSDKNYIYTVSVLRKVYWPLLDLIYLSRNAFMREENKIQEIDSLLFLPVVSRVGIEDFN